jgi:hypothetical protein
LALADWQTPVVATQFVCSSISISSSGSGSIVVASVGSRRRVSYHGMQIRIRKEGGEREKHLKVYLGHKST